MKKKGAVGFASLYLWRCKEESKSNDEISVQVYTKLINIDSRIGTTATEQLFWCVNLSLRFDLIKVRISSGVVILKSISDDKYGKS